MLHVYASRSFFTYIIKSVSQAYETVPKDTYISIWLLKQGVASGVFANCMLEPVQTMWLSHVCGIVHNGAGVGWLPLYTSCSRTLTLMSDSNWNAQPQFVTSDQPVTRM